MERLIGDGGSRTVELSLVAAGPDPRLLRVENGTQVWAARSNDPQFIARPAAQRQLPAGRYSASVRLTPIGGLIDEPRLYIPDATGNYSETLSVALSKSGSGYSATLVVPHAIDHFRFDPSKSPCEFTCDAIQLDSSPAGWSLPGFFSSILERRARPGDKALQAARAKARRKHQVLKNIRRDGIGIEIGASHDPIAPRREGFNVQVIDHLSQEELVVKFKDHAVALENIERVDFVWKGESYAELTGKTKHYDWIIASNVIEHTPDLVGFLNDCDSVLKDEGVLVLVIPDKRFCFDRFRPITGLARVIDGHVAPSRLHSPGAVAEYFMNVVGKGNEHSWDDATKGEYAFFHTADYAKAMIGEVQDKGSYLDIHNWCFVPSSFRLLVEDLFALGYTRLREVEFHPTEGYEFHVTLGRRGKGPSRSRMQLLRSIDRELSDID